MLSKVCNTSFNNAHNEQRNRIMALRDLYTTALAGLKVPSKANVDVCMRRLAEVASEGGERGKLASVYLSRLYDYMLAH